MSDTTEKPLGTIEEEMRATQTALDRLIDAYVVDGKKEAIRTDAAALLKMINNHLRLRRQASAA